MGILSVLQRRTSLNLSSRSGIAHGRALYSNWFWLIWVHIHPFCTSILHFFSQLLPYICVSLIVATYILHCMYDKLLIFLVACQPSFSLIRSFSLAPFFTYNIDNTPVESVQLFLLYIYSCNMICAIILISRLHFCLRWNYSIFFLSLCLAV